jgi:hypothetical protein
VEFGDTFQHSENMSVFDFNQPIATDTTKNELVKSFTAVFEKGKKTVGISLWPNPVNEVCLVEIEAPVGEEFTACLCQPDWKILSQTVMTAGKVNRLSMGNLPPGAYWLIFENDTHTGFAQVIKQ